MEELGTRFTNRKSENGNSLPKVLVRSVSIPLAIFFSRPNTGLKPGENEMKTFEKVRPIH